MNSRLLSEQAELLRQVSDILTDKQYKCLYHFSIMPYNDFVGMTIRNPIWLIISIKIDTHPS